MRRWTVYDLLMCLAAIIFILLLSVLCSYAQVPVALSPVAKQQFLDATGKPLAGGALFTFIAGTTTQQATYQDSAGTTPYPNPIILDAGGFVPGPLFISSNGYKFVLCAAFTAVAGTGTCASFGPQQWVIDNILLPPFLAGNNTFTGNNTFSGTTTFNGPVNLNAGGSLAGTFSGSPTFSGTPIFTGGMTVTGGTFTNSTLVTPTISSPTVTTTTVVPNLNPDRQSVVIANAAVTGTTLNALAKLTGAPSTAVVPAITDVGGVIGVVTAGAGTTGSATLQTNGIVSCIFDGATVAGDYVQISGAVAGNCHDVGGGGYPSSGQVVGRALTSNGGGGTYQMEGFPPDIRSPSVSTTFPNVVYSTPSVSTNANIGVTTMTTVGGSNATYRFSYYLSESVVGAGCTTVTSVRVNLIFQDPFAAGTTTFFQISNLTPNGNGVLGPGFDWTGGLTPVITWDFRMKAGTIVQYSTTYNIGSGCAPGPQYVAYPILEQLTSN